MMNRILCAAVLSALAVDTFAAVTHKHRHAHQKKDLSDVDWNNPDLYKDVNWASVFGDKNAAPAPTPAPAAAPAAPAAPVKNAVSSAAAAVQSVPSQVQGAVSGGDTGSSSGTGFGGVSTPIANGNVDEYIGNVGIPYGSNIIKISQSQANSFEYTNNFINKGSAPINVIVWNKSGPDGQPNSGQFSEPALSFTMGAGSSQLVAFDRNSQVAFCKDDGKRTEYGAKDCTYGEADFGNESNGGWSGYDVSSIQNSEGQNTAISISSPNGATSSNFGNNYVSDSQPGGIGGNLAPGNVRLTTTFG